LIAADGYAIIKQQLEALSKPSANLTAWIQLINAGLSSARVSSNYSSETTRQVVVRALSSLLLFTRGIPDDSKDIYVRTNLAQLLPEPSLVSIADKSILQYAKYLIERVGPLIVQMNK